MSSPLTAIYKHVPPTQITTDIYLPPSPSPSKHPILISIHGGAFMLGNSRMISQAQVQHCLNRNWIVVSPNHRLCPGVNLLEGPITDCRDLLAWIYGGKLDAFLAENGSGEFRADLENVFAVGTSSGGTLALALGFDVPRSVKGIVDFYGAVHFEHPSWNNPIPGLQAILPTNHLSEETLRKVYDLPAPIDSSVSLEGFQSDEPKPQRQSQPQEGTKEGPKPNFSNPRDCFAFTHLANGTVIDAIYPPSARDGDGGFKPVDPIMNITPSFPPTYIIHGLEDGMVSIDLSRALLGELEKNGVQCGMTEVPGEGHTFVAGMDVGSPTWERQLAGFEFLGGVIEASR